MEKLAGLKGGGRKDGVRERGPLIPAAYMDWRQQRGALARLSTSQSKGLLSVFP